MAPWVNENNTIRHNPEWLESKKLVDILNFADKDPEKLADNLDKLDIWNVTAWLFTSEMMNAISKNEESVKDFEKKPDWIEPTKWTTKTKPINSISEIINNSDKEIKVEPVVLQKISTDSMQTLDKNHALSLLELTEDIKIREKAQREAWWKLSKSYNEAISQIAWKSPGETMWWKLSWLLDNLGNADIWEIFALFLGIISKVLKGDFDFDLDLEDWEGLTKEQEYKNTLINEWVNDMSSQYLEWENWWVNLEYKDEIWKRYNKYKGYITNLWLQHWVSHIIIISDLKRLNPSADPSLSNWKNYGLYQFPMWDKFNAIGSDKEYKDTWKLWKAMSNKVWRELDPLDPIDQIEAWVALISYIKNLHQITDRQAATLLAKWLVEENGKIKDLIDLSDKDKLEIFNDNSEISPMWSDETYNWMFKWLDKNKKEKILKKYSEKLYWEENTINNPTNLAILAKAQWYLWVSEATWNNDWDPSRLFSQGRNEMWCANFITTILYQVWAINKKTRNNWKTISAKLLQKVLIEQWFDMLPNPGIDNIMPGDVIFMNSKNSNSWRHVWIVDKVRFNGTIVTIEWNRNDSVSRWTYKLEELTGLNFTVVRVSDSASNHINKESWLSAKLTGVLDRTFNKNSVKGHIKEYDNFVIKICW